MQKTECNYMSTMLMPIDKSAIRSWKFYGKYNSGHEMDSISEKEFIENFIEKLKHVFFYKFLNIIWIYEFLEYMKYNRKKFLIAFRDCIFYVYWNVLHLYSLFEERNTLIKISLSRFIVLNIRGKVNQY